MHNCRQALGHAGIPFLLGAVLMLVTFGLSMTIDRNAADHGRYKEHAEAKAEAATEPLLPQGVHVLSGAVAGSRAAPGGKGLMPQSRDACSRLCRYPEELLLQAALQWAHSLSIWHGSLTSLRALSN